METQPTQKRKNPRNMESSRHFFLKLLGRKDEQCYAVIDANYGFDKLHQDYMKTLKNQVNKKILEQLEQGVDPINLINLWVEFFPKSNVKVPG